MGQVNWGEHGWTFALVTADGRLYADGVATDSGCTKSGEIKLTAYSADRIQFDGQSCVLAVSEDVPRYHRHMSS